jgi:Fibronectin type III domain
LAGSYLTAGIIIAAVSTQTITFTAPASGSVNGSAPLTPTASSGLTVALSVDGATTNGACSLSGDTVHYLHPGSCVIDANQAGNADYAAATQVQQTIGVANTLPSPPTGVTAIAGNARAKVSWKAPTFNGGSPITGYTATASPGGARCTTTGAASCTITGLHNGTAYRFTVTARSAVGISKPSASSASVTPRSVLSVPWSLSKRSLVVLVVPYTGTHRYMIIARRTHAKAKSALCKLTGKGKARRARCTLTLTPGTWTLTAEALNSATRVIAQATHVVRVR